MILKGLKPHNFRGYKNVSLNIDNNISVLIGRNDVGKPTLRQNVVVKNRAC